MNWFLIALINPILLSAVNHFDKFLLSKYIKGGTVGALILFSALFAFIALPIIFLISPNVLSSVSLLQGLALMGNGGLLTLAILLYLYAMDSDEASYVVPFFELIPVFGFLLGFAILGEVLTMNQFIASITIILGSLIISVDVKTERYHLKKKLILLMVGSSFFYAINAVIFKSIASSQGFVDSLFWDMLGKFLLGVILFFVVKSYRTQFISLVKSNGRKIMSLNVLNEIMGIAGEISLIFAVLLAPVALVQSVGSIQSPLVFLFGIILTLFFPHLGEESLERKVLIQKILGIAVISLGIYFLK